MSVQYGKVISLILLERFGPVVEKVGAYLFKYGTTPLLYIKKSTNLPLSKVKESLCILIKYRLVTFQANRNENLANYTLQHDRILLMLRYPKYINLIKKKFGNECEMIVEEILQRSYWTASEVIMKVIERLKKDHNKVVTILSLREKFLTLLRAQYLGRLPYSQDDKPVPTLVITEIDHNTPPNIDPKQISLVQSNKATVESLPDNGIYWTINFDRFHQDMRDKLIVNAFTKRFDENGGEFVRLLLQQMYIRTTPWAEVSNPVPIVEIRDIVRKQATHQHLLAFFDQYVNVLEQDSTNLIRKAGDASGGSFQIYLKETFTQFAWETVEQIVLEKFDSKAARIFRLVKSKQYIEPDQIQQLAMIPAKEAKRISYQLLEENFLQVQELKKSSSNGPNKCFTLFYVDLEQIVRMILELCYKTLFNIMTRKNHERFVHKRIIDKKQRVDTIIMGMRAQGAAEEQLADIEEMITPPEREILQKIELTMKKLNSVELEIDETIFLIQMYLVYK
ncbi:DNA-directed RNA polymerase III subunit RPC3 [Asbolus verrucosus]|uniref:DNA-directed RNA polymerase III subunit RPC3 n=1 Tax=Asbolus verrucosus TaxID=1661398 RepID=A0A482V6M3_ASBVE|nr:DNA-directed RNA polymerase III subunit RPC3 [Asbolus verrucosus]